MSYTLEVKEELARVPLNTSMERFASLEAILRSAFEINYSGFKRIKLVFSARSNAITRYVIKLITSFHDTKYELYQKQIMRFDKPTLFYLEINEDSELFVEDFNLLDDNQERKAEILDSDIERIAYLRACFIACGSVNDPSSSSYHLEFSLADNKEAMFIQSLLNHYDFNARLVKRRDKYVVYVKEVRTIADILRVMGAVEVTFKLEENQIRKQLKTQTIRKINFDIANQGKTNDAARQELRYIRYLEYYYPLEQLDPKLLMVMKVRKDNPEASLNELVEILKEKYEEKISKSGLNHRFRKLKEIALDFQKRRN